MKLLLDEQIPRKLTRHFPPEFVVRTVQEQGWSGVENGELLKLAASQRFQALISADKNMSYQQDVRTLPVSVVVLEVVRLRIEELIPLLPRALEALSSASAPQFLRIRG